jgi:hypothetical protein
MLSFESGHGNFAEEQEPLYDPCKVANFISKCQFKYGGIAKSPEDTPGKYLALRFFHLPP